MKTKLFLDDVRSPLGEGWDVVRSYKEFVAYVEKNGCPDVISFDHDLAPDHYAVANGEATESSGGTGYDCAKWLRGRGWLPKEVIVHSFNPVGAIRIAEVFANKIPVLIAPRFM